MVERISALAGEELPRSFGPDLVLSERRIGSIWQLSAWPDQVAAAGKAAAKAAGAKTAPGPLSSVTGKAALLRTEPLKWLMVSEADVAGPKMGKTGTALDLSHARTVIRVEGEGASDLMARMMPLDLRSVAFPEGSVATSAIHHIAVTVHARDGGLDLYCFRSFGLAIWEHLIETAEQFAVA